MIETKVFTIDPNTFQDTGIQPVDSSLISLQQLDGQFDTNSNTVELYVYTQPQRLAQSLYNYSGWKSYQDPTLPNTGKLQNLYIDPTIDGRYAQITDGNAYLVYSFVNNELLSSNNQTFYISDISSNRTEVAIKTNNLTNEALKNVVGEFITTRNSKSYFDEFYFNIGSNREFTCINIQLDESDSNSYKVLLKLYNPLPSDIQIKTQGWIQTRIADPISYRVEYTTVLENVDNTIKIKQANFNLPITGKISNTTGFETLTSLTSTR